MQGVEFRTSWDPTEVQVYHAMTSLTGKYLEDQGDLVSRFITPRTHIVSLVIPISNLLTKSP